MLTPIVNIRQIKERANSTEAELKLQLPCFCCEEECAATFSADQIDRALPRKLREAYWSAIQERQVALSQLKDMHKCPHCGYWYQAPDQASPFAFDKSFRKSLLNLSMRYLCPVFVFYHCIVTMDFFMVCTPLSIPSAIPLKCPCSRSLFLSCSCHFFLKCQKQQSI
jgi:hypothetical protein